ncbi:helix-turn-helix domain-containing protein [Metabacillus schmidteae]|uniref:helix-turn-helix domain-containing protein n=1 Tax=Metabacillus schmidteae TaxID=2730405 RepID=UPI00158CACA0|nr:helix-turn-helix transcriptional regulator [Metabacillus schmidteae]
MENVTFGDFIRGLRLKNRISSRDLSSKIGKSFAYVSQLERGNIKKPDYETAYQLLEYLNVNQSEINDILNNKYRFSDNDFSFSNKYNLEIDYNNKLFNTSSIINKNDYNDGEIEDITKVQSNLLDEYFFSAIVNEMNKMNTVISNLKHLFQDEEGRKFFTSLFSYDLSKLDKKDKLFLLEQLHKIFEQQEETK